MEEGKDWISCVCKPSCPIRLRTLEIHLALAAASGPWKAAWMQVFHQTAKFHSQSTSYERTSNQSVQLDIKLNLNEYPHLGLRVIPENCHISLRMFVLVCTIRAALQF